MTTQTFTATEQNALDLLWESLKRDPDHADRKQTGYGTKTQTGLLACLRAIYHEDDAAHTALVEACEAAYHELRIRCGYQPGDACYEQLKAALALAKEGQP